MAHRRRDQLLVLVAFVVSTSVGIWADRRDVPSPLAPDPAIPQTNLSDIAVVHGEGSVEVAGQRVLIRQTSARLVVDWSRFQIPLQTAVHFDQPDTASLVLLRIDGPARILGSIHANGRVLIENAAGVVIDPRATITAASLVITTGRVDPEEFTSGADTLHLREMQRGRIDNAGDIAVSAGGTSAFVAPHVVNSGVIRADGGRVTLAAGGEATVTILNDGTVSAAPTAPVDDALVENHGTIEADGGRVAFGAYSSAEAAPVVEMKGVARARSLGRSRGVVEIDGGPAGEVRITGRIDVTSTGRGGDVMLTGQRIAVEQATIDASGSTGGGTVYVGGGLHGSSEEVPGTASVTRISAGTVIHADALDHGNGGTVVVWGDRETSYSGLTTAQGGARGGDGGMVEVSTGGALHFDGLVKTIAPAGRAGQVLIDPVSVSIGNGPTGPNYFNAAELAANLVFSSMEVIADQNIDVVDDVNLADNPDFGHAVGDLILNAGTLNLSHDVIFGDGAIRFNATTVNLDGRITSGGALSKAPKVQGTATYVNVLSNRASLQQAIDFASIVTPATILVAHDQQYRGNLTIGKSLNLIGNPGDPLVAGADTSAPHVVGMASNGTVISIAASNVTVNGLILDAPIGEEFNSSDVGISAAGSNLAIRDNTFVGFDVNGVALAATGSGGSIQYNRFVGIGSAPLAVTGAATVTNNATESAPGGAFRQVSAGRSHTCAVGNDRTLACWGDDTSGKATPPPGSFVQVSAGYAHSCAVRNDGTVACWGDNSGGKATPPPDTFIQVSAGPYETCGVRMDGSAFCWGLPATPSGTFVQVSAGDYHNCGVLFGGSVVCWEDDTYGQGSPPPDKFVHVSAGTYHTCGVRADGTVACWGDNGNGMGTPPAGAFVEVAAGTNHTCGVRLAGSVSCWGSNAQGAALPPGGVFSQISANTSHSCGVRPDGSIACWGSNAYGESTPPGSLTAQTITVLQSAPSTAVFNSSFPVSATASSGLTVAIAASGSCSLNAGTVTMTSGTGTCQVTFDQAGDATYSAATQIVQNATAQPATPGLSVTGGSFAADGNTHAASGFAYGVGGVGNVLSPAVSFTYAGTNGTSYGPTSTPPADAGTYAATAFFAGNANYTSASDIVALAIVSDNGTPPDTTLLSAPPPASLSRAATFVFTADEAATFTCSLDGADFSACISPVEYVGLADGNHTFAVQAADLVNNPDTTPASHSWSLNTSGAYRVVRYYSLPGAPTLGAFPSSPPFQAGDGYIYGTTAAGGPHSSGLAYRFDQAGHYSSVSSFPTSTQSYGRLTRASDAKFYGTAQSGSAYRFGATGPLETLHALNHYTEGSSPYGGVTEGPDGQFYGTTSTGAEFDAGAVFKMTATGTVTVLHPFAYDGSEGYASRSPLILGSDGNFYGTTSSRGAFDAGGTIFVVTPDGALTVLHSFNPAAGEGDGPSGGLTPGPAGYFYGTTVSGGADGWGTAYRIDASGNFEPLHSFTSTEGVYPQGELILASDGNFYGVTRTGGAYGGGTAYRMTAAGEVTVLHSFGNGYDGGFPVGVIQGTDGALYGTTQQGYGYGSAATGGVIFRLDIGVVVQTPAITSSSTSAFTVGNAGTFTVTTSGIPTVAVISKGGALPAGVTFTNNGDGTATLAGTPDVGTDGTYPLQITAENGVAPDAVQAFTLTVNPGVTTVAPAIASASAVVFTIGSAGSFLITTTGTPDVSTISAGGALPSGVSFLDNGDGTATLSGTPAAGTSGAYPLSIAAANGVIPNASQAFTLTVNLASQGITVTQAAPLSAGYHDHFTVAAAAGSGLQVAYSSGSPLVCTNVGATFTMQVSSGTCIVRFDQAGNGTYAAALQLTNSTTAAKGDQIITITQAAPASAPFNSSFTVAATAGSALPVSYSTGSPSVCTNSGATFTMVSGTGTCVVRYNQPGNANYAVAPQKTNSTTATKAAQTITVTQSAPASAVVNTSFTVAATVGSGLPVTYGSGAPSVCTNVGANFTMVSDTGICVVQYDQTGNTNYAAATQVTSSTTATSAAGADLIEQSVSNPPALAVPGGTFLVTDTVVNRGTADARKSTTRYFLSLNTTRDADIRTGGQRNVAKLPAGAISSGSVTVTVPDDTPVGRYYLLACADTRQKVKESNETNNCTTSTTMVQVVRPDLRVTSVSNPPGTAARGESFSINDTTTNLGAGSASSSTTKFYLSADLLKNGGDKAAGGHPLSMLGSGSDVSSTTMLTVPRGVAPGLYYVLACADDGEAIGETDETNNCLAASVRLIVQ